MTDLLIDYSIWNTFSFEFGTITKPITMTVVETEVKTEESTVAWPNQVVFRDAMTGKQVRCHGGYYLKDLWSCSYKLLLKWLSHQHWESLHLL